MISQYYSGIGRDFIGPHAVVCEADRAVRASYVGRGTTCSIAPLGTQP
jgi:hypothetical protein